MKKCPVCDGSIVNGRCRLCGMPYRNDEILYHLNESRSDHYRHATEKAKATMRQQQVPFSDRKAEQNKKAAQNAAKAEIKARQQQVRQDAMQRMTNTRVPVSAKTVQPGKTQRKSYSTIDEKPKKKINVGKIIAIVIALWAFIPGLIGVAVEFVQDEVISQFSLGDYQEIDSDYYLRAFLKEEEMVLIKESGADLRPGTYIVYIEDGYADILVGNAEDYENYRLEAGNNMIEVTVEDGDAIAVEAVDTPSRYVDIYQPD